MIELDYNNMTLDEVYQIHEKTGTIFAVEDGKVIEVQDEQD